MNNLLYPERLRDNNANGSVIKVERFLKDNVPKIFLLKVFNPTKSMHYYSLADLSQIHKTWKVPTYTKEIDQVGQANNLKMILTRLTITVLL